MEPFNWRCPFCDHNATITSESYHSDHTILLKKICPNKDCNKSSLFCILSKAKYDGSRDYVSTNLIKRWNLIPQSDAKPLPSYIPKAITEDYYEACSIRELSPKASATLSRRCLQSMIRDFWGVKGKSKLKQEIDAIQGKVDPITWDAIDSVRKIGNIGAHMEEDINLIIDVEPGEAKLLIQLIESLIKEWYISKYEREENMKKIIKVSTDKDLQKKKPKIKKTP